MAGGQEPRSRRRRSVNWAQVVLKSLSADPENRKKLRQEGLTDVKFTRLDVNDLSTIIASKELIEKEDGQLDVLVNNAGTSWTRGSGPS
jgi:NAD(P)-dependent dehydrogenase (short-subunit alcohol dehydrogenase family)